MKTLSLKIETLRELTPDETAKINGGIAQPTSSVFHPQPVVTAPVVQPTSSVRPTGPITAPVHHRRHHHHR
jgi:hypothetical protein